MGMIKIGHRIINTDLIAHINFNAIKSNSAGTKEGVRITLLSQTYTQDAMSGNRMTISETLFFQGEEAEAVRWHFKDEEDVVGMYRTLGNLG